MTWRMRGQFSRHVFCQLFAQFVLRLLRGFDFIQRLRNLLWHFVYVC